MKSLVLFLLSLSIFAQDANVRRVEEQSRRVYEMTLDRARDLNEAQLRELSLLFRDAIGILSGRNHKLFCNEEPDFRNTFDKVYQLAFSSSGLDLSSTEARAYAQNLIETKSCADAISLVTFAGELRKFAWSASGMNLSSTEAKEYALSRSPRYCLGFEYQSYYKNQYDYAWSSRGLNLPASEARKYAISKLDERAFSCR